MEYFSFIRRDLWKEANSPVTGQEDALSETTPTKEARSRLKRPKLLVAGPVIPVVALSGACESGHSLKDAANSITHTKSKSKKSTGLNAFAKADIDAQDEVKITWSFPFAGSPICSVCSRNHIGRTSTLNRQVFWTLRHLRVSCAVCASCLMIANAMGKLLHTDAEDGLVCSRVEHFATDCRSLLEARRLWLFTTSVDQIRGHSKQSLGPRSYLEPEQPTSKTTLGCVQLFGNKGSSLFSGRFVSPDRTDFGLISGWLSTCESSHNAKCGRDGHKSVEAPALRVIDVVQGCVVVAPVNCRYFALSYVWGAFRQLQLNSSTLDDLSTEGFLLEGKVEDIHQTRQCEEGGTIPKTIRDAIKLCQKLGERFLWVDSLCILQDSADDKHNQISHMDSVYREAVLTMVAAAGDDCNHGLPGVRERQPISFVAHTGDMPLISTDRDVIQTMLSSKWNKRAWTLQEKIVSQRLLVFTPQLVFFYCHTALWREDIMLEDSQADIYLNEREVLDSQILDRSAASHGPVKAFTESYAPLVTSFVCRELSREEDALSAFSGVCRSLEPALGSFRWGLPSHLLGISMLWRASLPDYTDLDDHRYVSSYVRSTPMLSQSPRPSVHGNYEGGRLFLQPEDALGIDQRPPTPLSFDPDTDLVTSNIHQTWNMRSGFPSWSWTGWNHVEDTQIFFNQPLDIRALLSFYSVTFSDPISQGKTGSKTPTNTGPIVTLALFSRCGLDLYRIREELQDHLKPPTNPPPFTLTGPSRYHHQTTNNNDGDILTTTTTPSPDTLLAFWTSTSLATIRVRPDNNTLTISTSSGQRMAELHTNRRLEMRLGGLLEFIVVAYTLEGDLLLMLVQWSEWGIAYRAPVLDLEFRITQEKWLDNGPCKKRILLG